MVQTEELAGFLCAAEDIFILLADIHSPFQDFLVRGIIQGDPHYSIQFKRSEGKGLFGLLASILLADSSEEQKDKKSRQQDTGK